MMRNLKLVVGLSLALIAIGGSVLARLPAPSSEKSDVYRTYRNARFNYSISYPAHLLTPQGESDNGDGQVFSAQGRSAEMRVWGQNNFNNESLRASFVKTTGEWGDGVTFKVIRADWFVVTALAKGKIHYQKTFLRHGVFKTFTIEYDASRRATYDAITARIARSFVG